VKQPPAQKPAGRDKTGCDAAIASRVFRDAMGDWHFPVAVKKFW
jgi:hypothetical protein